MGVAGRRESAGSLLGNAADSPSVVPVVAILRIDAAIIEVEVPCVGRAIYGTRPVVAVVAGVVQHLAVHVPSAYKE